MPSLGSLVGPNGYSLCRELTGGRTHLSTREDGLLHGNLDGTGVRNVDDGERVDHYLVDPDRGMFRFDARGTRTSKRCSFGRSATAEGNHSLLNVLVPDVGPRRRWRTSFSWAKSESNYATASIVTRMFWNEISRLLVCCMLLTAGCAGVGSQQGTTTEYSSDWKLTIEEEYPDSFTVIVKSDSSGEELANRTYDATDHGTIDVSSGIPSGEVVVVEITDGNTTLWKKRIAPSEAYELRIRKDGTVEETLYES